jgi:hypothetical protein
MSLLALLSFDAAPGQPALARAVNDALGPRRRIRLLQRLWKVEFQSRDDFRGFADALEALHAAQPRAFDYLALLYDLDGGTVLIAPDPGVREPAPMGRAAAPAAAHLGGTVPAGGRRAAKSGVTHGKAKPRRTSRPPARKVGPGAGPAARGGAAAKRRGR